MDTNGEAPRSRRAILAAAAGAAGALAASAAIPAVVAAADPNDVVKDVDNVTGSTTSITTSAIGTTAFAGNAIGDGAGFGVRGTSAGGAGVYGWSVSAPDGLDPANTSHTGVFGSSPAGDGTTTFGVGVWGDSADTGVYGSGTYGVEGLGRRGVSGYADDTAGAIGLYGWAPTTSQFGLRVDGKVRFTNRAGRKSMTSGHSSVVVSAAGLTSTSRVFAVLATSESGRWVRAVVPAAGKFTVYLNTTLTSSAVVAWFALD
jgi:hypothetical protein